MESSNASNLKFVCLIEEHKIILRKAQNPLMKRMKREAIEVVIDKWFKLQGKKLDEKAISKKVSNLKERTKTTAGKGLPLEEWQMKLSEMMKVRMSILVSDLNFRNVFGQNWMVDDLDLMVDDLDLWILR